MPFSAGKIVQYVESVRRECSLLNSDYYNAVWNDVVHDSFEQYNDVCKRNVDDAKNLADTCHRICDRLNDLDIEKKEKAANDDMAKVDKLVSDAMNLCRGG